MFTGHSINSTTHLDIFGSNLFVGIQNSFLHFSLLINTFMAQPTSFTYYQKSVLYIHVPPQNLDVQRLYATPDELQAASLLLGLRGSKTMLAASYTMVSVSHFYHHNDSKGGINMTTECDCDP
jgi:hypothetical protein